MFNRIACSKMCSVNIIETPVHFAVEVNSAFVQSKPVDGSDEKFRPWTPGRVALFDIDLIFSLR